MPREALTDRKKKIKATTMPVANYKTYCTMLDRARSGRFAFPAINVTSLTTANAVLRGLAESKSDGIIQVSSGGGAFASGLSLKDMALGAIAIAEHVHRAAERYPIYVALHTDHCLKDKLDKFVLQAMVGVQRDVDRITLRGAMNVLRDRNRAERHILERRARRERAAARGDLNDPVAFALRESAQHGIRGSE